LVEGYLIPEPREKRNYRTLVILITVSSQFRYKAIVTLPQKACSVLPPYPLTAWCWLVYTAETCGSWLKMHVISYCYDVGVSSNKFHCRENQLIDGHILLKGVNKLRRVISTRVVRFGWNSVYMICSKCCWIFMSLVKIGAAKVIFFCMDINAFTCKRVPWNSVTCWQ
jgi:hypothetical protein